MTTLTELRAKFISGEYTPLQAVQTALDTIKEKNGEINAFLATY